MECWMQDNTWDMVQNAICAGKATAIIPVGSTEQHGRHLPVGTDTYVAITLAEAAAAETNALAVPPIWYGWCPHHMVLPGTVSIRPEVLSEYLYDVIESLAHHGIKRFVIVNGHRIVNIIWMQVAAEKAQRTLGVTVKLFDPAYMSKDILETLDYGPVGHAEEIETAQMLYRYGDLVHMENAVDNPILPTELYSVDPSYPHDTLCYVPSTTNAARISAAQAGGVTGQPTKATKEKGKIYHEYLVKNLVTVIKALQDEA